MLERCKPLMPFWVSGGQPAWSASLRASRLDDMNRRFDDLGTLHRFGVQAIKTNGFDRLEIPILRKQPV
jgi:hypothetical protein